MTNEKQVKHLKLIDFEKNLWYFIITERKTKKSGGIINVK